MNVLHGMRIVEGSAFVAAPLGGMTLAQMGADVIRFDAIGGGIDYHRWPVTPDGTSLFWLGMNKGKRSIAVDLRRPEGQELVTSLICGEGTDGGIFLSNFPAAGWLSDERLRQRRADLIYVSIIGNPDGSTAVDYTVNPSSGFAYATGPAGSSHPTNHVLPAWDIATGMTAATSLLAAERFRSRTGHGGMITVSLADVAFAMAANLGYVAQAQVLDEGRPPIGNDLYGAFGRDFATADDRRVMVVAISLKQWQALTRATEIDAHLPAIEAALGLDFRDEGDRFRGRDAVGALIAPWVANRRLSEVGAVFDRMGVCWGPYQTFSQLVSDDWRCSPQNPMFRDIDQPGLGTIRIPGTPSAFTATPRVDPRPAPLLGQHTDEVLAEELGLTATEIGELHDRGIVAGPLVSK